MNYSNEKVLRMEQALSIFGIAVGIVSILAVIIMKDKALIWIPMIGFGIMFLLTVLAEVILPSYRLREIFSAQRKLIGVPIVYILANIIGMCVFVYFYIIVKNDNSLPLLIFLIILAVQRYVPISKIVKNYIARNPEEFPEHLREQEQLEDDIQPGEDE